MTNLIDNLLTDGPKVINIGLRSFFEACNSQGASSVHIQWQPPAQGNHELLALLDKLL
ncbi:MAG: fdrA domain protein [Candidatus Hodarchaeales archaeon]